MAVIFFKFCTCCPVWECCLDWQQILRKTGHDNGLTIQPNTGLCLLREMTLPLKSTFGFQLLRCKNQCGEKPEHYHWKKKLSEKLASSKDTIYYASLRKIHELLRGPMIKKGKILSIHINNISSYTYPPWEYTFCHL